MISLVPNWHDCDVLGHLFITSQFNWPRALHLWFVWSHVVLIGSCHFKSNLQSPHVWPFIRWCSPTTRLFFKAHATLRQYDVTSFYKTEGCFQALARRTGMGGNAWKCIRTCGYIQLYIYTHTYLHLHTYSFFFLSKLLFFPFSPPFVFLCFFFRSMFFFVQSVPSCLSTFKLQRTIPFVFRRSNLFDQITVMVVCVNAVWIVGVDPVKLTSSRGIVSLDGFCFQLEVDLYIIYMYTQLDECFLFFIFFKCCLFFPNDVFFFKWVLMSHFQWNVGNLISQRAVPPAIPVGPSEMLRSQIDVADFCKEPWKLANGT